MTATEKKVISSVNTEERKNLGIRSGDTVRVWLKVDDGDDMRLQQFEGVVIATKHGTEPGATFTVRRSIDGVGVEKTFPLYSPRIDKIEITKRARMRRSKLYHIRDEAARQIKRQMRRMIQVDIATESDTEAKKKAAEEEAAAEEAEKQGDDESEESEAGDEESQEASGEKEEADNEEGTDEAEEEESETEEKEE